MENGYSIHLVEYQFEGETWILEVPARSFEEAEQRVAVAGQWGRCIGGNAQKVPAQLGWWVRLMCWCRNLAR